MDLSVLLSHQVIAGVIIVSMLLLSLRSILLYSRRASEIRPRLMQLDRELAKRHESTAEKKKAVAALERLVAPLRDQEASLRSYYEELRAIELEEERKFLAKRQEEEAQRKVRIQRKKMGFD